MRLLLVLLACNFACAEMLQYCDNNPSPEWLIADLASYGVRVTPSYPGGVVDDVSVYVSLAGFSAGSYHLKISLWRFNGSAPYDMFYEHEFTGSPYYVDQWRNFQVGQSWSGDGETEFVVAVQCVPSGPTNPTYCNFHMDYSFMPPNRNWRMPIGWSWEQLFNGDILIKTHFCCSNPVESSSIGSIKASFAR